MAGVRKKRATVEESIVGTLMDVASRFQRQGERLAEGVGLTTQQWLLLLEIAGDPSFRNDGTEGVLASDLARARGVSNANMSVLISKLIDRDLVVQSADPQDGRRKRLVITEKGKQIVEALEPDRRQANRRLFRKFSAEERRAFLGLLIRCREGLEDTEQQA